MRHDEYIIHWTTSHGMTITKSFSDSTRAYNFLNHALDNIPLSRSDRIIMTEPTGRTTTYTHDGRRWARETNH